MYDKSLLNISILYICIFERRSENLPIMKQPLSNHFRVMTIMSFKKSCFSSYK